MEYPAAIFNQGTIRTAEAGDPNGIPIGPLMTGALGFFIRPEYNDGGPDERVERPAQQYIEP